jgi:hypothetical protein
MKPTSTAPEAIRLPREEWDFRACNPKTNPWYDEKKYGPYTFLDVAEVYRCLQYEWDRDDLDLDGEIVIERRKEAGAGGWDVTTFEGLLKLYYATDGNGKAGHPPLANWFFYVWPDWPQTPYLKIPESSRRSRFKAMWKELPKRTLPLVKLVDIFKDVETWKAVRDQPPDEVRKAAFRLPYWRRDILDLEEDAWTVRARRAKSDAPPREIAAFEIDFALSPKRLTKLFENWVRQRCEAKGYRFKQNRGSASQTDAMRDALLVIGVRRLLRAGMTPEEAHAYVEKASGRPLLPTPGEWETAVDLAGQRLNWPTRGS